MNFLILFENDMKSLFPELFLIIICSKIILIGLFFDRSLKIKNFVLINQLIWNLILVLLIVLLLINNYSFVSSSLMGFNIILTNTLIVDYFTNNIKTVVLLSILGCLLISIRFIKIQKINNFEYVCLILLANFGIFLFISSYDLITLYLTLELQSFCFYILASFKKNSAFSTEAGLKYFILGAFSSGFLLLGCSLIYGFTGTTNFEELKNLLINLDFITTNVLSSGILMGLIFITLSFLFKLAAAPFHVWAPDVYEGSYTSVTTFFTIIPKITILSLFLRLYYEVFYDLIHFGQKIFIICSIASLIIGAFVAFQQQKLKRLLAYSAINHIGYILIGFATCTIEGIQSLLLYIYIYIIMSINIWGIVLSKQFKNKDKLVRYLVDLKLLSKINPILAFTLMICLFSMAGVPPLAGFVAKMYIFFAAIESSLYFLAIIGILTSILGTFYYLKLIKIVYFEKSDNWNFYEMIDKEKSLVLGSTLLIILFFFFIPTFFILITHFQSLVFNL